MIPIRDLFESHLTVANLQRSMTFFGGVLGFELAEVFPERKVAFYWIGGRGNSMLGLWEVGSGPQQLSLHLAFRSDLHELLEAPARLRSAGIVPLDFDGAPTEEPVVLAWMPAASLYFRDPDGNLLEFLSMLPDPPQPEQSSPLESLESTKRPRLSWLPKRLIRLLRMLDFTITIRIDSSPERVWAVMRDVEHWPEWTPTVSQIRWLDPGRLAVGSRARIWQPRLLPATWTVTGLDEEKRIFVWETRGPGMRLEGRHSVEAAGNSSQATLSLRFSGPLGPLLARLTRNLSTRYLAIEANGLRKWSEESTTSAPTRPHEFQL